MWFTIFPGLFNISDKLLVSIDILLELREYFRYGVPLTVAIESKLAVLSLKAKQVSRQWFYPLHWSSVGLLNENINQECSRRFCML